MERRIGTDDGYARRAGVIAGSRGTVVAARLSAHRRRQQALRVTSRRQGHSTNMTGFILSGLLSTLPRRRMRPSRTNKCGRRAGVCQRRLMLLADPGDLHTLRTPASARCQSWFASHGVTPTGDRLACALTACRDEGLACRGPRLHPASVVVISEIDVAPITVKRLEVMRMLPSRDRSAERGALLVCSAEVDTTPNACVDHFVQRG